jgi:uncharacterized protein YbaP (TraB family)
MRIRKFDLKGILLIVFVFIVFKAETNDNNLENQLLWKISGNGLTEESYLFGTIHAICFEEFQLPSEIREVISKSRRLTLEINLDNPGMVQVMQNSMLLEGNQTISSHLDEADYLKIAAFMKDSIGMDFRMIERIKPIFLQSLILPKMLGCMPASVESVLMAMAKEGDLEIDGLETLEEQMAVLTNIDFATQVSFLVETVNDFEKAKGELRSLIELYKEQNIQALYDLINKSELQAFESALLDSRNENWIPIMTEMAKDKSTLFAVGAGHLAGSKGVINLLRGAGYTVEPYTKSK